MISHRSSTSAWKPPAYQDHCLFEKERWTDAARCGDGRQYRRPCLVLHRLAQQCQRGVAQAAASITTSRAASRCPSGPTRPAPPNRRSAPASNMASGSLTPNAETRSDHRVDGGDHPGQFARRPSWTYVAFDRFFDRDAKVRLTP